MCFPSKADNGTVEFLSLGNFLDNCEKKIWHTGKENNMMWAAKAHSTEISLMEMNYQGDKLATASSKVLLLWEKNFKQI